jgi:DNA-binding response OmpR family regulator
MKNARILILEDEEQWNKTIATALADHEILYFQGAPTLAKAESLIGRIYFNIAIVDISMRENDPKDSQGMEFLRLLKQHHLDRVIHPIILSAYGSLERARRAFRDHQVVDFLDKAEFDDETLLAAIRKALHDHHLDGELKVQTAGDGAISTLWSHFDWAQREEKESPSQIEPEFYDLLRRLFAGADSLFLRQIQAGQSGAGIAEVEAVYNAQVAEPVILKFGKKETIHREHTNYTAHIEKFVGAHSSTQLDYAPGRVMSAVRYSLVGTELGTHSFADYYARNDLAAVRKAFDNLFNVTCGRWYNNKEQPRVYRNLVELYAEGLHIVHPGTGEDRWGELWENAGRIGVDLAQERLRYPGVAGDFANPKHWLEQRKYQIYRSVWRSVTHGDLNEHNILVTEDGRTWLIDFYRTGVGHILRDVVELETAIKFNLTLISDLETYRQFEEYLLTQTRINQLLAPDPGHPHHKALSAIGYLRNIADNFTGTDKGMVEYNIALLLQTLNLLRLDFMRPHHFKILLSASMLCDVLE